MTDLRHHSPSAPPIGAALRAFRTPVRGHAFAARPAGAPAPHPGQPLQLRREPANPADPYAVAVWTVPAGGTAAAGGTSDPAGLAADPTGGATAPSGAMADGATDTATSWRIGYLDRQVAARLAPRLDAGMQVEARIDGWIAEPQGRWRRPVVLLRPGTADLPPPLAPAPAPPARVRPPRGDGPGLWGRPPGVRVRPVR
ncbi:hypothetical protein [Egicoccus sp. AB-alg2]|uniref:hypothetical protein n=1 Tax=Egicoccus sp. AB-alg2 TaxID=3242693 RepID=UPI00359EFCED